jgi:hypothetical protein
MTIQTRWLVLVASAVLLAGVTRSEDKPAVPAEFACAAAKLGKAATLDGVVEKDEYPARTLTLQQTPERAKIAGKAATAYVFHDGTTLFVAVTVPLEKAADVSKGESWGSDDGAEVCVRDASGAQPGPTFIVHGFASGKHECTGDGGAPSEAVTKLEKAVKIAAKVDKQSWTGEWAIPFEALGIRYKPGTALGFNLGGWRAENAEWFVWRGALGATYDLDNGGKLTLE